MRPCSHSPRHWRHRGPILGCTQCGHAIGHMCASCDGSGGFHLLPPTSHLISDGCETCGGLGWILDQAEVPA